MKKLSLNRETLQHLDRLEGVEGGLPSNTTRVPPMDYSLQMTCALSCMRNCDFTSRIPL